MTMFCSAAKIPKAKQIGFGIGRLKCQVPQRDVRLFLVLIHLIVLVSAIATFTAARCSQTSVHTHYLRMSTEMEEISMHDGVTMKKYLTISQQELTNGIHNHIEEILYITSFNLLLYWLIYGVAVSYKFGGVCEKCILIVSVPHTVVMAVWELGLAAFFANIEHVGFYATWAPTLATIFIVTSVVQLGTAMLPILMSGSTSVFQNMDGIFTIGRHLHRNGELPLTIEQTRREPGRRATALATGRHTQQPGDRQRSSATGRNTRQPGAGEHPSTTGQYSRQPVHRELPSTAGQHARQPVYRELPSTAGQHARQPVHRELPSTTGQHARQPGYRELPLAIGRNTRQSVDRELISATGRNTRQSVDRELISATGRHSQQSGDSWRRHGNNPEYVEFNPFESSLYLTEMPEQILRRESPGCIAGMEEISIRTEQGVLDNMTQVYSKNGKKAVDNMTQVYSKNGVKAVDTMTQMNSNNGYKAGTCGDSHQYNLPPSHRKADNILPGVYLNGSDSDCIYSNILEDYMDMKGEMPRRPTIY